MSKQQAAAANVVAVGNRIIIPFADNLSTDSYTERTYQNLFITDRTITRFAVDAVYAATGSAPRVAVSSTTGTGGPKIQVNMSPGKIRGAQTGNLAIAAGGTIYVGFTDCNEWGNAILVMDYE